MDGVSYVLSERGHVLSYSRYKVVLYENSEDFYKKKAKWEKRFSHTILPPFPGGSWILVIEKRNNTHYFLDIETGSIIDPPSLP